ATELAGRSRKLLTQDRRMRRRLEAGFGAVRLEWRNTSHAMLDHLLRWKSAQYRSTGAIDALGRPWTRAVLHELLDGQEDECRGQLSVLRAGDRVLALHFGLAGTSVLHYWFPAYDPELAAYSPGMLLLLGLAVAAAEHGFTMVDLGLGEHGYKLRLATGSY